MSYLDADMSAIVVMLVAMVAVMMMMMMMMMMMVVPGSHDEDEHDSNANSTANQEVVAAQVQPSPRRACLTSFKRRPRTCCFLRPCHHFSVSSVCAYSHIFTEWRSGLDIIPYSTIETEIGCGCYAICLLFSSAPGHCVAFFLLDTCHDTSKIDWGLKSLA